MPLRAPKGFIDESDPRVCQIGHPAPPWLINYADLMTEMVCFFVILYALSVALNPKVQEVKKYVEEMIEAGEIKGEVTLTKEGLMVSLQEQGTTPFFESGFAELTPSMITMLDKLAPVMKEVLSSQEILIEGHTDDIPISNEYYDSNWELSTYRAVTVLRYFVDKHGYPPGRLGAVGYGEHRPIVPNDSPDHRAKNRRVVLFVKNTSRSKTPTETGMEGEKTSEAPQAKAGE